MTRKKATELRKQQLGNWFLQIGETEVDFAVEEELDTGTYLARALLLRGIARCVRADADPSQLEYPGGSRAVEDLLEAGADKERLATALKAAQWQSLWQLVCMLDDSTTGIDDLQATISDNVQWGVFRVNEEGEPTGPLAGLHEDLMELLPAEQEVNTRKKKKKKKKPGES